MYSVFWEEEGEVFNHFTSLQVNKITCEQRHFVISWKQNFLYRNIIGIVLLLVYDQLLPSLVSKVEIVSLAHTTLVNVAEKYRMKTEQPSCTNKRKYLKRCRSPIGHYVDCSQSPIFSWDHLDMPCLTVMAILIFKCTEGASVGDYS